MPEAIQVPEEAVEAVAQCDANCAGTWGHNGGRFWDDLCESERDGYRGNARAILQAALPAIRKQLAEELLSDEAVEAAADATWAHNFGSQKGVRDALQAALDTTTEGGEG